MKTDRTGETYPICGKGKLHPTGQRMVKEPAPDFNFIRRFFTKLFA